MNQSTQTGWNFKMFYDGECPMCTREVAFLMKRNKNGTLIFENTKAPDFDPDVYGLPKSSDRIIHGALPDGTLVKGVEVFRRAYKEVGLGWLLAPTGWPLLRPIFDRLYLLFARHRIKIGKMLGRCDGPTCEIPDKNT